MGVYGFKKGDKPKKKARKVYVFTRTVYEGITEAAKATGISISNINVLAKSERMKGDLVFSFNDELGQNFNLTNFIP